MFDFNNCDAIPGCIEFNERLPQDSGASMSKPKSQGHVADRRGAKHFFPRIWLRRASGSGLPPADRAIG